MANLGNLIVRGVTRILGDAYANKFIGNLQGNADTATSAIKASTADSATNATSANKASITTAVQDYGTSDYREIKIGYRGSGLSSSTIETAVGFTESGTKIKDISKDEFRNWLATASGTWGINITGFAGSVAWENVTGKPSSYIPAKHNHEKITHILWSYYDAIPDTTSPTDICARFGISNASVNAVFTGMVQEPNGTRYQSLFWTNYGAAGLVELTKSYGGDGRLKYRVSSGWGDNGAHWSTAGYRELANVEDLTWANIKSKPETATRWPSWSEITSKPTTISGYGITDALIRKSIVYKLDYQKYVILLCQIDSNSTNQQHTINGTFWSTMTGGIRYQAAYINVHCSDWTSGHNGYYGFTPFGLGTESRLVTCTYQSSQYLAITFENTQATSIYFDGSYSNILFTPILYYTADTSTIDNSEIYNSITEVTYNKIPLILSAETALTSSNYNSYAPKLDGTGASGTWGINITGNAATATNADLLDGYHASNLVKFYLSPMTDGAPADSATSWFVNTMPSGTGAIVYNVPGSEKTIIAGKSTGAYGHMLQLNYEDNYLRILRYCAGKWITSDWEKISAGYADSAEDADKLDGYHANDFATAWHTHSLGNKSASDLSSTYPQGISVGGIYSNGYPFAYGCTITASGNGGYFQIAGQWNSNVTGDSNYDFPTEMYIRGRRDSYDVWTTWTRVLTDRNYTNVLDNRYIQSETDPIWTADKVNYYTKTECNNKFQPKGTYLTEQNLQGYATQEWVRGEEYLYRSGGTMDARAEIGITTKLFIGNSTSSDTCYTKFNCILHGGGDESNPNWIIRDNGYSEFKSSVSANAFYASSDIRLKNILDDINIDFDKLKLIPKKYYTWKGSDILQLGTIAQDIQKIYPEVVSKNENGYLSVDYSKLSIIALAAIDKLNERIKELECQIKL